METSQNNSNTASINFLTETVNTIIDKFKNLLPEVILKSLEDRVRFTKHQIDDIINNATKDQNLTTLDCNDIFSDLKDDEYEECMVYVVERFREREKNDLKHIATLDIPHLTLNILKRLIDNVFDTATKNQNTAILDFNLIIGGLPKEYYEEYATYIVETYKKRKNDLMHIEDINFSNKIVLDMEIIKKIKIDLHIKKSLKRSSNTVLDFHPDYSKLILNNKDLVYLANALKDDNRAQEVVSINLSNNIITELSKEIKDLKNLETLDLSDNIITELSKEIKDLKNLRKLDLSNNALTELPKEITDLDNLEELYLDKNNLTELPVGLEHLENIVLIALNGNPNFPQNVIDEINAITYQNLMKDLDPIFQSLIDSLDSQHQSIINSYKNTIFKFFGALSTSYLTNEEMVNKITKPTAKRILEDVISDYNPKETSENNTIVMLKTSLGNCPTPVLNLFMQLYIGNIVKQRYDDIQGGSLDINKIPDVNLLKKLTMMTQIDKCIKDVPDIAKNHEVVEIKEALSNYFFLDPNQTDEAKYKKLLSEISNKDYVNSFSPNIDFGLNYFYREGEISKKAREILDNLRKMICETGQNGETIKDKQDKYLISNDKMNNILESYLASNGFWTPKQNQIAVKASEIQALLESEKYFEIAIEYDNPDAKNIMNLLNDGCEPIKNDLAKIPYYSLEQFNEACEDYKKQLIAKADQVLDRISHSVVDISNLANASESESSITNPLHQAQEQDNNRKKTINKYSVVHFFPW